MRIIETNINDIEKDISKAKNSIADNVISFIQPLFDNEYKAKLRELQAIKISNERKKEKIKQEKNLLEVMLKDYSKKDKERQLLLKMGKLIQNNLIQEAMKGEMSIMLKSFENFSEEKIVSYLNDVIRILSQKFAKH